MCNCCDGHKVTLNPNLLFWQKQRSGFEVLNSGEFWSRSGVVDLSGTAAALRGFEIYFSETLDLLM